MTNREEAFCYELAYFMRFPRSFEIGGIENSLKEIIKAMTKGNKRFRAKVFDLLEYFAGEGDFDKGAYDTTDSDDALNKMKQDYDIVFYK